jgi:AcrR family transcriptional regulator
MEKNPLPVSTADLADRIALDALAKRVPERSLEVRRLLDAGLMVMQTRGTTSRPRVADIVAAAGLSNDAFYRYFESKDAFVAAILDDGMARLASYLSHQMAKRHEPREKIAAWVDGVLSQAVDPSAAATTLAVLYNAGSVSARPGERPPSASALLGDLLVEPLTELESPSPALDASLLAHAVVGQLSEFLWHRVQPTTAQRARVVELCLALTSL